MLTLTMLNQKGGVGKTSCTHHLAGALSAMGKRVLLIDNDPQASLSQGFWGPMAVREIPAEETVAAIYAGHHPYPSQVIRTSGIERIDLVAGSKAATPFNLPEPESLDLALQVSLRDFLATVRIDCRYDLVLIDCPPNLHLCSFAALVASDFLIVPLQPEDYGAQGIADVQNSVDLVQGGPNPDLVLLGYLLTMVSREKIHEVFEASLRETYGADVFAAMVPRTPIYKEAIAIRKPIAQYKPKGQPAQKIAEVALELLARINLHQTAADLAEVA